MEPEPEPEAGGGDEHAGIASLVPGQLDQLYAKMELSTRRDLADWCALAASAYPPPRPARRAQPAMASQPWGRAATFSQAPLFINKGGTVFQSI